MFGEENATNVAGLPTAPAPALDAATVAPAGAAGELAPGSAEAARETSVSSADHDRIEALVRACVPEALRDHLAEVPLITAEHLEQITSSAVERCSVLLQDLVDNAKADILKHLTPMLTAVVEKSAAAPDPAAPNPAPAAHELTVGDPVRVYADPQRKQFYTGTIETVHDGGHAYDVKLGDGTVTKVPAGGLDFDDHA